MRSEKLTIFGVIAYHFYFEPGDASPTYDFTKTNEYTDGIIYYVKGNPDVVFVRNGQVIDTRSPGMLTTELPKPINYEPNEVLGFQFKDQTEWICFPYKNNPSELPRINSLVIKAGEKTIVRNNSKIFLARGNIKVKEKMFGENKELIIRSGDIEFEAIEDSYLLIIA